MRQMLGLMDLIWKASLCSGGQCIGPAYGVWFLLESEKDTAASVLHSPFRAAKPSLSEHVNCLFNWFLQLRERQTYTKSIRYFHTYIQHSLFLGCYLCLNTIRFFLSSTSLSAVVSSRSNFWTLLFVQLSGLRYIYEGEF